MTDRIQTVTVYTLVERYTLTVPEAVARFKRGPQYEPCELEMMQADLMKHLSEEATEKLQAYKDKMRRALSSEAFISQL